MLTNVATMGFNLELEFTSHHARGMDNTKRTRVVINASSKVNIKGCQLLIQLTLPHSVLSRR